MVYIINVNGKGLSDLASSVPTSYNGSIDTLWCRVVVQGVMHLVCKRPDEMWEAIGLPYIGKKYASVKKSWAFGPHLFA
jgi:hypothetical protein